MRETGRTRFHESLICPYHLLYFGPAPAVKRCRQRERGGSKLLYSFDNYVLDTDRRELRSGTEAISVQPQVFDLLAYLIRYRERVVSKGGRRNVETVSCSICAR